MKQSLALITTAIVSINISGFQLAYADSQSTTTAHTVPPSPSKQLVSLAKYVGSRVGVDPNLILAIAFVESSFDPKKTGGLGEVGLMQLRPEFNPGVNYQPLDNLVFGARYLKKIKSLCKFKEGFTYVACYNSGPNTKLTSPSSSPYYNKVIQAYASLAAR